MLIAYLSGDLVELQKSVDRAKGHSWMAWMAWMEKLTRLRFQIRTRSIDRELIASLWGNRVDPGSPLDEVWLAESFFVIGMAYETLDEQNSARDFYQKAAAAFEKLGARKKAVKAILNYLSAESRMNTEKSFLVDYHFLYRRAKKVGQNSVAAVALLNISREYQKIGAYQIALKYVDRALILHQNDARTLPYYLILVHRCHLYCQLASWKDAQLDYEQASIATFPEIQGALKVIESFKPKFGRFSDSSSSQENLTEGNLTSTWKRRLRDGAIVFSKLGPHEQKIIGLLSRGPRDKFRLIEKVYGDTLPFFQAENRLKNLLNRIRKKHPGLIHFENGRYRLMEDSILCEKREQVI